MNWPNASLFTIRTGHSVNNAKTESPLKIHAHQHENKDRNHSQGVGKTVGCTLSDPGHRVLSQRPVVRLELAHPRRWDRPKPLDE